MKKEILFIGLLLSLAFSQIARAQGTQFTYQGSLKNAGIAANGNFDFEFALFDAVSAGNQLGSTITLNNVAVVNGIFSVRLDFGNQFPGANRFLEVHVRQSGGGAFTPLSPREIVTSAPYSVLSQSANTAVNATMLGGVTANQYVLTSDARLSDARNPLPNSTNYIQNRTTQQTSSNFNISGTGTAGILNAVTQFNVGGSRVLFSSGFNLFVGVGAGPTNNQGNFNSFFGFNAGRFTTGDSNSFFGSGAGQLNGTGTQNTFIGDTAGGGTSTGFQNTFLGFGAGAANTTGTRNTTIGAAADVMGTLTNATAIGFQAAVSQSNSLVLGSISGVNNSSANTNVGIGTPIPLKRLHIKGAGDQEIMIESSDTGGTKWSLQSSDGNSNGRFEIINRSSNLSRFTILANGRIGIGTTNPAGELDVRGTIKTDFVDVAGNLDVTGFTVTGFGTGGFTPLCANSSNQIALCGSSVRYKTNINPFNPGLDLIRKLRPVSFNWKVNNLADFGLVAEEVADVEPLLVTHNDKGGVEGVKYDRVGVVLVNAVNEQQTQIEALEKQIDNQKEIINQQTEKLTRQQTELDALKKLVCALSQTAEICKPNK